MSQINATSPLLDSPLNDDEWLATLGWRKGSPAPLVDAAHKGDVDKFAAALKKQSPLSPKRQLKLVAAIRELHSGGATCGPLKTALVQSESPSEEGLDASVAQALDQLGNSPAPVAEVVSGLALVLAASSKLSPAVLVSLWRWCVVQSTAWIEDQSSEGEPETLSDLLSITELPLLAGIALPHLKLTKKWTSSGQKAWSQWCDATTDTDGTLDSGWIGNILQILQSLGRSETYLNVVEGTLLGGKFATTIELLVARSLCLATPGRLTDFSSAEPNAMAGTVSDLAAALTALGYKKNHPAKRLLGLYADSANRGKRLGVRTWALPDESHQSDWAEWACLRSSWDADLDQVLIRHAETQPILDIVLSGQPVFSGMWDAQLQLDGVPWDSKYWECSCVFHDDDADYVELQQIDAERGVTITRQILLNKANRGLFLVDVVKSNQPGELKYRWELPFASELFSKNGQSQAGEPRLEFDALTREAAVQLDDLRLRLFPMGWPQDRFSPLQGKLSLDREGVSMEVRTEGSGLCLPLFLDWHPPRRDTPCDWTPLTVAEDGQPVGNSDAFGCRLRLGREQWLYFHNLRRGELPRTVLGHHTLYETVIARFKRGGEIVPLVQVELD